MGNFRDYSSKIDIKEGYALVMFVDYFGVTKYPILNTDITERLERDFDSKLLDMRVFNEEREYRIFRGDTSSKNFYFRILDDSCYKDFYFDEQFLDVDTTRSDINNGLVRAIGGGCYIMPLESILNNTNKDLGNIKINIKNYLDYDDCGQSYITDWRIVSIK